MQKMQPIRAFVDKIEGNVAVLLLGEDESVKAEWPVSMLPNGVKEGVVLRLGFSVDEHAAMEGKAMVKKLMDDLGNNP